jgi:hypothetical protein
MQTQPQWGDRRARPDFGKIGGPNIKAYSYAEPRYYCTTCFHTFNADRGTFFETVRTDRQVILNVVAMSVERNSLRAICRIHHCKRDTTLHWLELAGQQAAAVSRHFMTGLHLTQAQIDELWTFIKNQEHLPAGDPNDLGDACVWRAIALPSRVRVVHHPSHRVVRKTRAHS